MGVKVKEYPKNSGDFYIFIHHKGKRKAMKVGKNKRLAIQAADKITEKLLTGDYNIEKSDCPTFKPYAERWLSMPHDWKESTKESYRFNLDRHVYPAFGKLRIDAITRKTLKAFFDNLMISGLKPKTVKLIKAPIRGVLTHAVDSEIISRNPLDSLKVKGTHNGFKVEPLTEDQAAGLLEQAKIYLDGKYYPHFLTLLRTGIRLGELTALKWKDIDFDKRQIEIRRSARQGRVTDTKNHKTRFVDITPKLTETLKNYHTAQKRAALKTGKPFSEFVFSGDRSDHLTPSALTNALERCLTAAKINRIRIHDLRHSYATMRLLRGHSLPDVSYQLGHQSIQMTVDLYSHWVPGRFKSEVDDLDNTQKSVNIGKQNLEV